MEKSKGEKTLKQKVLAGVLAGALTIGATVGLAGCKEDASAAPAQPKVEQPANPGAETEQSGDADDGADLAPPDTGEVTDGRGGTLVPEEDPETGASDYSDFVPPLDKSVSIPDDDPRTNGLHRGVSGLEGAYYAMDISQVLYYLDKTDWVWYKVQDGTYHATDASQKEWYIDGGPNDPNNK
jgi:hypothetical protein